ncbi:hypothetical protein TruAng_000650 [Truncatella angustata]|nr:hypothetical protein TruAng_000650 [Truncatella angustata]
MFFVKTMAFAALVAGTLSAPAVTTTHTVASVTNSCKRRSCHRTYVWPRHLRRPWHLLSSSGHHNGRHDDGSSPADDDQPDQQPWGGSEHVPLQQHRRFPRRLGWFPSSCRALDIDIYRDKLWAGNLTIGLARFSFNRFLSAVEANFVVPKDHDGIHFTDAGADIDASFATGYYVPLTCSCDGIKVTGCNKDLFSLSTCPNLDAPGACRNPVVLDTDMAAADFFKPCAGQAYTYPNDQRAIALKSALAPTLFAVGKIDKSPKQTTHISTLSNQSSTKTADAPEYAVCPRSPFDAFAPFTPLKIQIKKYDLTCMAIEGLGPAPYVDIREVYKVLRRELGCGDLIVSDPEAGEGILLQGDHRAKAKELFSSSFSSSSSSNQPQQDAVVVLEDSERDGIPGSQELWPLPSPRTPRTPRTRRARKQKQLKSAVHGLCS